MSDFLKKQVFSFVEKPANAEQTAKADDGKLEDFQAQLYRAGVEIRWPDVRGY